MGDRNFLRVSLLFLGLLILSTILLQQFQQLGYLDPLIQGTAVVSAYLMNLLGLKAVFSVDKILLKSRTLLITLECTAVFLVAIYASLVIAYPARLTRKLLGLGVGIPAIMIANIIRLVMIAWVAEHLAPAFPYVHDYLWQIAFIMAITGLWLLWLKGDQESETKDPVRA